MPDLTIQVFACCESSKNWSKLYKGSTGRTYEVRWANYGHKEETEYGYSCTCAAFKYRPGLCKHINAVMHEHCNWHEFLDKESITEDGKCPRCLGPIEYENWAV